MSKIDGAKKNVLDLEEKVEIIGSSIIRNNRIVVISSLPDEANEWMITAMSAALLSTSKRTALTLFNGNIKGRNVELSNGNMFLLDAGRVILVFLAKNGPDRGLITLKIEATTEKLKKYLRWCN